MHILNGFNAEMCLGLTVTLITAPHTDKYAIATIKSYPIMGKIFLYLINKSIKGGKKVFNNGTFSFLPFTSLVAEIGLGIGLIPPPPYLASHCF